MSVIKQKTPKVKDFQQPFFEYADQKMGNKEILHYKSFNEKENNLHIKNKEFSFQIPNKNLAIEKVEQLEMENKALKKENSKIKALYEDRLEELNWYYQKYGYQNINQQQEEFTQATGKLNSFSSVHFLFILS